MQEMKFSAPEALTRLVEARHPLPLAGEGLERNILISQESKKTPFSRWREKRFRPKVRFETKKGRG
jgi:hypothetical protein